ncbi:hypothetical protein pdam_00022940 [Pocillopora damicornis]|uniref:Uncharacterized protein n=1 Tax=Pocillopora damicornis TaxID=46731 RepID=A0A3M6UNJ7_POCDA|nr:hypothetical protein pdam_00022940 [Pocillopora damicornis]
MKASETGFRSHELLRPPRKQAAVSCFNPFTPTSDQDRISPYNINTISSRQVMRIQKNINHGIIRELYIFLGKVKETQQDSKPVAVATMVNVSSTTHSWIPGNTITLNMKLETKDKRQISILERKQDWIDPQFRE